MLYRPKELYRSSITRSSKFIKSPSLKPHNEITFQTLISKKTRATVICIRQTQYKKKNLGIAGMLERKS